MGILCYDLLYCELFLTFVVLCQPNHTETTLPQQLDLRETVGKSLAINFLLLFGQVFRLVLQTILFIGLTAILAAVIDKECVILAGLSDQFLPDC